MTFIADFYFGNCHARFPHITWYLALFRVQMRNKMCLQKLKLHLRLTRMFSWILKGRCSCFHSTQKLKLELDFGKHLTKKILVNSLSGSYVCDWWIMSDFFQVINWLPPVILSDLFVFKTDGLKNKKTKNWWFQLMQRKYQVLTSSQIAERKIKWTIYICLHCIRWFSSWAMLFSLKQSFPFFFNYLLSESLCLLSLPTLVW